MDELDELVQCSICHGYFELFGQDGIIVHLRKAHPDSVPGRTIELAMQDPVPMLRLEP